MVVVVMCVYVCVCVLGCVRLGYTSFLPVASSLQCSGDITAVNINDLPLEGIESRYWRVSVPQLVDVPVSLARAEFM